MSFDIVAIITIGENDYTIAFMTKTGAMIKMKNANLKEKNWRLWQKKTKIVLISWYNNDE